MKENEQALASELWIYACLRSEKLELTSMQRCGVLATLAAHAAMEESFPVSTQAEDRVEKMLKH